MDRFRRCSLLLLFAILSSLVPVATVHATPVPPPRGAGLTLFPPRTCSADRAAGH
ncbi:MAG: hypothetical protein H0X37_04470 [Herpetosiphonaceae bacterium]|nr:hypothetical protein [Herpetosiphonaceae bacterium]